MSYLLEMNQKLLEKIALQRKELEDLRRASQVSNIQRQIQPTPVDTEETITSDIKKESGFEEEIKKYLELLELIDKEDDIEKEVLGILPQEDDYDKERLIKRLYIDYCKKIRQTIDFIESEKRYGTDEEELVSFYGEVKKYEEIKNTLRKNMQLDTKREEDSIPKNKLLFLTTNSGRVKVFESINDMDPNYYPPLNELFTSIIDGTFRDSKPLIGNSRFNGILEVRNVDNNLRILYMPLSSNYYAILGAIIKKTDSNSYYRTSIMSMLNSFNSQKESLEKGLENPEFCRQQEAYTKALFEKLNFPKKQDAKKKVKTTANP